MMNKKYVWLTVAVAAVMLLGSPLVCVGVSGAFVGLMSMCGASAPKPAKSHSKWGVHQRANASIIINIGRRRQVPTRAIAVALVAAMAESSLINRPDGHLDSVGLFQMRPSMGWGDPKDLFKPEYATNTFYDRLLKIPDWEKKTIGLAAQAVERSAFPDRYAGFEPDAIAFLQEAGLNADQATPGDASQCSTGDSAVFTRAATWLTAWAGGPVPYSMVDTYNGYRRDCSGFVSMALGLNGPGFSTSGLVARSTRITKEELRPGDMIINPPDGPAGHVTLFERWTDTSMTRYLAYEQAGGRGTLHHEIPYPYFGGGAGFVPYRLNK
jgi:hypothetical protein